MDCLFVIVKWWILNVQCAMIDMLISLIGTSCYNVPLVHMQFLFVNYTSVNLGAEIKCSSQLILIDYFIQMPR